jgi:pimeloyl-ACP methyl ester carboxylesterase
MWGYINRRGRLVRKARSGSQAHHLASLGVAAALLLVLAPTARSTAQDASAEAQKRCAQSVAAVIGGKRVCLRAGQACKWTLDRQYHRYGFHCHSDHLVRSKPKPPPVFSRKVDVGGHRLAISCRGTGSPTVVLESGAGWGDGAWYRLQPSLATTTRACSYDRAGLESSDDRRPPDPVPAAKVVEELHSLLAGAGISPPYVLGGWSLGGFFNRLYTTRYPAEVAGLVAVDGTPIGLPGEESWLNSPGQPHRSHRGTGVPRLLLPGGRWRGARSRAGSGNASPRRADARTFRGTPRRLRSPVVEVAEARRPAVDVVDPRPRRVRGPRHPTRRSRPDGRGVPPGRRRCSKPCPASLVQRNASARPERHLPRSDELRVKRNLRHKGGQPCTAQ